MSDNTNSGHAKNVANLRKMNQTIANIGSSYNPANAGISLKGLSDLEIKAEEKLQAVNDKLIAWKNATNAREIAFAGIDQLSTRLVAMLSSFSVTTQTLNDAAAILHTLRNTAKLTKADAGKTAPAGAPDATPTPVDENKTKVSTSKKSFDAREELFGRLVLILQNEPLYNSNDPEFTKEGLQTRLDDIKQKNSQANDAWAELKAARIERNRFFYSQKDSLLETMRQTKAYVKGLMGANSQHFKAVAGIRFTRVVPAQKAI